MTDLASRVRLFLGHLDADTPQKMHRRGVWNDMDDGAGSALGSPALNATFERWLYAAQSRMTESTEITCYHVGRAEGAICSTCATLGSDGEPFETGVRRYEREMYRYPMHAALARLHGQRVRPGRPRLSEALHAIASASGDLSDAAAALTHRYPVMADQSTALAHFDLALRQVERVWREDAPSRLLPRTKGLQETCQ